MDNKDFDQCRKELGMSTTQLAAELGLKLMTINRYIRGIKKVPKPVQLALQTIKRNKLKAIVLYVDTPLGENISFKEFGKELKQNRKQRGLLHKDLSGLTGLSISYISEVENGHIRDLNLLNIQKFASAVGVNVEVFFEYASRQIIMTKTKRTKPAPEHKS